MDAVEMFVKQVNEIGAMEVNINCPLLPEVSIRLKSGLSSPTCKPFSGSSTITKGEIEERW